jgi:rhamnogalacturonan endolyase
MKLTLTIALIHFLAGAVWAQDALIYEADFTKEIERHEWIVESESGANVVRTEQGRLVIDAAGGVTVWLNKLLEGNIRIEYERTVLMDGKAHDRLSDLNQFWMAQDPRNPNLFTRSGTFEEYDSLQLYYAGMGGNSNTTTRFRKYDGQGNRVLLHEYKDEAHLLKANRKYHISIIIKDDATSFWVDGECYFSYRDPAPLREGNFGFRSVHSRQEVANFRIYQLP